MQTYQVQVRRDNAQQVIATTRTFHLTLGAKRGDETVGFNPVETLLSGYGRLCAHLVGDGGRLIPSPH